MFARFRNLPIKLKVTLISSLLLAVSLSLAVLLITQHVSTTLHQSFAQGARKDTLVLSRSLGTLLAQTPSEAAFSSLEKLLDSSTRDLNLVAFALDKPDSTPWFFRQPSQLGRHPVPTQAFAPELVLGPEALETIVRIEHAREPLATLRLAFPLQELLQEIQHVRLLSLGLASLIFLVGCLLTYRLAGGLANPLRQMTDSFTRMAIGEVQLPELAVRAQDEVGKLANAFNALLSQFKSLNQHAQEIAHGHFGATLEVEGDLADAFRTMSYSLQELTLNFQNLSQAIRERTQSILTTAHQQEASAAQQAASVAEVTATMEELAATARQISNNAMSVTQSAEKAAGAVVEGQLALSSFVQGIESIQSGNRTINDNIIQLNRHVQQISGILNMINDIADRSDLLALNAALEGTKAGQAGKGFLLVAEEMRRLAENVFNQTAEIKQLIREVTEATNATVMATENGMAKTKEGVERAHDAELAFNLIIETIEETSKASKQISLATQQQHTGTEQIVAAMGEVAVVSQKWVEGIGQTTRSVSELSKMASDLSGLVQNLNSRGA